MAFRETTWWKTKTMKSMRRTLSEVFCRNLHVVRKLFHVAANFFQSFAFFGCFFSQLFRKVHEPSCKNGYVSFTFCLKLAWKKTDFSIFFWKFGCVPGSSIQLFSAILAKALLKKLAAEWLLIGFAFLASPSWIWKKFFYDALMGVSNYFILHGQFRHLAYLNSECFHRWSNGLFKFLR